LAWVKLGLRLRLRFGLRLGLRLRLELRLGLKSTLKIEIFNCNYLENYSDSAHTAKTKNAPFFLNFSNMYKLWTLLSDWTGPIYLSDWTDFKIFFYRNLCLQSHGREF
jgi:hypothetical protein